MKITKVECIPVTLKLHKEVMMSGGALKGSTCVLVKIHTDEGIVGIADSGGTSEWYGGDTQESIMAMINNYYAPKALLGEDPFNVEKIVAKMDKIAKNNNQSAYSGDGEQWFRRKPNICPNDDEQVFG